MLLVITSKEVFLRVFSEHILLFFVKINKTFTSNLYALAMQVRYFFVQICECYQIRGPPVRFERSKSKEQFNEKNRSKKMPYIFIDGQRIHVTEEVYLAYQKGKRKFRYFEKDIKRERVKINQKDKKEKILPKKEISYEYLIWEEGRDFIDESKDVEEEVIRTLMIEVVRDAITTLTEDEKQIINGLFFENKPGKMIAKELGVSEMTISKRKHAILKKLRTILTQ